MTIQKVSRRVALILLAVCLLGSTLLGALPVPASAEETTTTIYFLNSKGWTEVGAYIYGAQGELLGGWGTTKAVVDEGQWVKVGVSAAPPYNIIFYNTQNEAERAELLLDAPNKVYVTADAKAYTSKAEAAGGTPAAPVGYIYFHNSMGWPEVGAYIYGDQGELLGSWGTTKAVADEGQWVKVGVSAMPPYSIIFYNTQDDTQRAELFLDAADKSYVTADAKAYTSKADATGGAPAEPPVTPTEPPVTPTEPPVTPAEPVGYIYFRNAKEWPEVGAYIYGDQGELLGAWGTTKTVADEGQWVKVGVPAMPPYSIIFYNTQDDTQRAELFLDAENKIYVTPRGLGYTTREAAENEKELTGNYDIYFLNSNGWAEVGAYIYGDQGELLGSWGTSWAEAATELGGDWMKIHVAALPPYNIIFYNKADETQRAELLLDTPESIYVTAGAKAYTSKDEAEAYAGVTDVIDPNNPSYGPNTEVIPTMTGTAPTPNEPESGSSLWLIVAAGVVLVAAVAGGVAFVVIRKKSPR